jgi:hypothetical protein
MPTKTLRKAQRKLKQIDGMEKITAYIMVQGSISDLVKQVNEKIREGYEPFGSPFTSGQTVGVIAYPPMVKRS